MIANPTCTLTDAGEEQQRFDASIRRYLPGLSVLAIPLVPAEGELIGLVVLYRKGEQPFTDADVALAELVAPSTAAAIRRND
jgi:GAF domain-containing protein